MTGDTGLHDLNRLVAYTILEKSYREPSAKARVQENSRKLKAAGKMLPA